MKETVQAAFLNLGSLKLVDFKFQNSLASKLELRSIHLQAAKVEEYWVKGK